MALLWFYQASRTNSSEHQCRLSILVTAQVAFTGSSLIHIQFISRTKSKSAVSGNIFKCLLISAQTFVPVDLWAISIYH
jgi:hypothetical protein